MHENILTQSCRYSSTFFPSLPQRLSKQCQAQRDFLKTRLLLLPAYRANQSTRAGSQSDRGGEVVVVVGGLVGGGKCVTVRGSFFFFHGPACHAAPVHLCRGTGDFSGDTVADRRPLSHLDPPLRRLARPTCTHQIGVKYLKLLTYLAR